VIPLPDDIKDKILAWLPKNLVGYDYPLVETDGIVPDLIVPAITFYVSSNAPTGQYRNTILSTERTAEGQMDDSWGEYYYCTFNVVPRALDKAELSKMWRAFMRQCQQTSRDLLMRIDQVHFVEILNSQPLQPQRIDGGTLYWAQVDLRFEYAMSDISDADYLEQYTAVLAVNNGSEATDSEIEFEGNKTDSQ